MNHTLHILNRLSRLKIKLDLVPEKPGVYLHKNSKNEIIYVGKAKNLKNRLKSYFSHQGGQTHKTHALVDQIEDFDFILTQNEYESIIAENNLIKHHKPRYNVLLKDSKTYPYLKIDLHDKWPQLTFVRRKKMDGALYFGPYPNSGELDKILGVIHKFFPLVRCSKHTFKTISRPCNYYSIHQCLAPCHLKVDHQAYLNIVNQVIALLRGKTKEVIAQIKTEMMQASQDQNFEKAARLRDSIYALESISEKQYVDLNIPLNIDFISFFCSKNYFVFYVSHVQDGVFVGTDSYVNELPESMTAADEIFISLMLQFYDTHETPEKIFFIDEANILTHSEKNNLTDFISKKHNKNVLLFTHKKELFTALKIKKELQKSIEFLTDLCVNNAKHKLEEKIKINSSATEKLLDVQKLLNLPKLPQWIECYDISTFQGTATVGSRVVFKNGVPCKSMYRKYIIRDFSGKMDDFAGLKEVLRRRFKTGFTEEIDLLMVDGGTPQVREVAYLFKSLGIENLFFVGIAKQRTSSDFKNTHVQMSQERLVIPARDENNELLPAEPPHILELDPHSKAFQVLVSLRDEAHRFAITFHRKRRDPIKQSSSKI